MSYLDTMAPETKRAMFLVFSVVGILLVVFFYMQFFTKKGVVVRVDTVPNDAVVTVDGKRLSSGSVRLSPGDHTFIARKAGFEKAEDKVTIKDPTEKKSVQLLLTPVSSSAIAWAEQNQKLYQRAEQKAAEEVVTEGEEFSNKFPISKLLPFKNLLFGIDYTAQDSKAGFKLQISATSPADRAYAVEQIRNWGYEPGDYEIEFLDFANPLRTGD